MHDKDSKLLWEAYVSESNYESKVRPDMMTGQISGNEYGDKYMDEDPHAHPAMKKPIPLKFRVAEQPETIQTKEGPVEAPVGAYIMTGTEGEQWPIPAEKFQETYDIIDGDTASKKSIPVTAKQMGRNFNVTVSWSDQKLIGKRGDWLVKYGPGDYGVVDQKIFKKTYDVDDPNAPQFDEYGRRIDIDPGKSDPRFR